MSNTSPKVLYIFGCSGIAKSVIDTILGAGNLEPEKIILVEKDPKKIDRVFYRSVKVISSEAFYDLGYWKGNFLCAFYKPYDIFKRAQFCRDIEASTGLEPATIIDKKSSVSPSAEVGKGVYIAPGVIVDADAVIGDHTIILFNSIVSRECVVADNNFLSACNVIKGSVRIGPNNFISSQCVLTNDIGSYNFINSGSVVTGALRDRCVLGRRADYLEMELPLSDSAAERKLRFLNP